MINLQFDLDLVAKCASEAMNHPASTKMPSEFAAQHGTIFPKAVIPDPLPAVKPGGSGSVFSDPPATVTVGPTGALLRKELFGYKNYGQNDGAADILYAAQQATWHFPIPRRLT